MASAFTGESHSMALSFAGEAVATSIIDNIIGAAYTAMEEKFLRADDVEPELERLKYALPQIKAVLYAIESDEINNQNEALTAWMWQFRDAVESAEDVLDEMAYYEIEQKIQQSQNENVDSLTSRFKRKFGVFVNRMFKVDDLGISKRLAKAVKELDKAAATVHNFYNIGKGSDIKKKNIGKGSGRFRGKTYDGKNADNDRETVSNIKENEVFGRLKERDSIVEWLTVDPSIHNVALSACTILGIGGLGKTTLAQLIYNDERVKGFFEQIIWVYVSDKFDAVTIMGKILGSPTIRTLTALEENLKELMSTRFLLVLDDVWNDENRSQWEKLVAPLKFGYGKILVTTRMKSVADMIDKVIEQKSYRLKLDGLEEKEFLKLFNKHAFAGADPYEFKNLHKIGKQIATKLGGFPLAAKIMGGVLNYSLELEYWNKVLNEEIQNFHVGKDDIMVVLRLSYYHLPTYLQLCFRYCSIFPKNYEFNKDELIKMWMGSRLIEPGCKRQMPEDIGREYFNRLVKKSFFDLNSKNLYVMHDLLHDLAQSVSKGECSRIGGDSYEYDIPRTTRHLGSNMRSLLSVKEISHLKNLRTLFITFEDEQLPDSSDVEIFSEVLKRLKSLRLLKIRITWGCLFKMPDVIGQLIHLRYLSHELTSAMDELPWFPKTVYKLYHLEVIKFKAAYISDMEENEANGIINLTKLRYIDVGPEILGQIASIGKLTFLQELESFPVGSKSGHTISELRDLQSLRKLAITDLDNIRDPSEAKEAKLIVKENLNSLSLSWPQGGLVTGRTQAVQATHEQILNNLQPHTNLQELKIEEYVGTRYPFWMTYSVLVNLISLDLCRCFFLASLPALGKLPLLKFLRLMNLPQVTKIDQTFHGSDGTECAFPVLKELTIQGLSELKHWDEVQGVTLFPRLEKLTIGRCGVDVALLDSIRNCTALTVLKLEGCPHISSLPSFETLRNLKALTHFVISCCPQLSSLGGLQALTSLRSLKIDNCTNLIAISSLQPPLLANNNDSNQMLLGRLIIDRPSLLLLDPLRSLKSAEGLRITNASGLTSMPEEWLLQNRKTLIFLHVEGARNLEFLPACMERLELLEHLEIDDAPLIKSLPDLPPSLVNLWMSGCDHELIEKYQKDTGPEWYKIAFVSCAVFY